MEEQSRVKVCEAGFERTVGACARPEQISSKTSYESQAIRLTMQKRANEEAYRAVRREILQRDGWCCQQFGRRKCLEVRHIRRRSDVGEDCEANLNAVFADCHDSIS